MLPSQQALVGTSLGPVPPETPGLRGSAQTRTSWMSGAVPAPPSSPPSPFLPLIPALAPVLTTHELMRVRRQEPCLPRICRCLGREPG